MNREIRCARQQGKQYTSWAAYKGTWARAKSNTHTTNEHLSTNEIREKQRTGLLKAGYDFSHKTGAIFVAYTWCTTRGATGHKAVMIRRMGVSLNVVRRLHREKSVRVPGRHTKRAGIEVAETGLPQQLVWQRHNSPRRVFLPRTNGEREQQKFFTIPRGCPNTSTELPRAAQGSKARGQLTVANVVHTFRRGRSRKRTRRVYFQTRGK